MVVAPLSNRAAFPCGGAGESSVHGRRRIRNCSVHSPPVPGTSIAPPCSCRRSWFSGRGAVGGGSMPRQQQQLRQHWSRDSGIPRQQQQLQHWFHDGGIPRQQQQQWSRGGGNPHQHQRSSHTIPPARPARQQPSRGIHTSGGDGEHGRTPFQHLQLKRCPTPVSSPLRLRRLWRKRPRHQRARHRRQYLQQRRRPAVLFSPLHRWGGGQGAHSCI